MDVERDLLFFADQSNEPGAGGVGGAVESESHDADCQDVLCTTLQSYIVFSSNTNKFNSSRSHSALEQLLQNYKTFGLISKSEKGTYSAIVSRRKLAANTNMLRW